MSSSRLGRSLLETEPGTSNLAPEIMCKAFGPMHWPRSIFILFERGFETTVAADSTGPTSPATSPESPPNHLRHHLRRRQRLRHHREVIPRRFRGDSDTILRRFRRRFRRRFPQSMPTRSLTARVSRTPFLENAGRLLGRRRSTVK